MRGNSSSYGLVGDLRLAVSTDPCVFHDVLLVYISIVLHFLGKRINM